MFSKLSDIELWRKITYGNESAYEEIYCRYSKKLFFYALNILKDKEACEDIIQNVFIDLWTKKKEIQLLNPKAYLFQSVKFQVLKDIRNNGISQAHLAKLNILEFVRDASQEMEYLELAKSIETEIEKLPPACQKIFVMSRIQGLSNQEIAESLNISIQAVKNQVSKALKILRSKISPEVLTLFICWSTNFLEPLN